MISFQSCLLSNVHRTLIAFAIVAVLSLLPATPLQADLSGKRAGSGSSIGNGERRVSLTRSVEPSFRAEPVVHRFKGRRGEVIPFVFELASTGKVMNVDIRPISLRQEETGIILHDEQGEPMDGVRFTSPLQFELRPGEKVRIEGEVTVPLAKTNYVSFGILVRDRGQVSDGPADELDEGQTRAAIRFVTQYVLRVDIETGAQDVGDMDRLQFETGELIDENGKPVVRTYLNNPTDYALECRVRSRLVSKTRGAASDPVRLHMPSRSELEDDERYLVRIMPRSRLRLVGNVEGLLAAGSYDLDVQLSNGRRTMVEAAFPIDVQQDSFKALETQIASFGDGLIVQPAQIELGRIDGTDRMTTLQVTNDGSESKTIHLVPRDHTGAPLTGVMLSSKKFSVKPGRTKSIRAILRGSSEMDSQWGMIDVIVDQGSGDQAAPDKSLALSLIHVQRPEIRFDSDELQWAQLPAGNAFVMRVTNQSEGYAPIDGLLMLAARTGHPMKLTDGYGKWLAPGESKELQFRVPDFLKPGSYQLRLEVRSGAEHVIEERTLVLELTEDMLTRKTAQLQ